MSDASLASERPDCTCHPASLFNFRRAVSGGNAVRTGEELSNSSAFHESAVTRLRDVGQSRDFPWGLGSRYIRFFDKNMAMALTSIAPSAMNIEVFKHCSVLCNGSVRPIILSADRVVRPQLQGAIS